MRKIIIIISLVLYLNNTYSQSKINWKEDLDYMKSYLEIVHPAPYAFVSKEEFEKDFYYLRNNYIDMNDQEIVIRIKELFAKIQDGHTGCDFLSKNNEYLRGLFHYYPIRLYVFSDGLFVISAKNEHKEIVGKKIVKIGNLQLEEFIKQISRFNFGDNKWGKTHTLTLYQEFLQYAGVIDKDTDALDLIYEDENGKELRYIVQPESTKAFYSNKKVFPQKNSMITTMTDNCNQPLPLYLSHINKPGWAGENYWYQYLPKHNAIYLQINSNQNKEDESFDLFCLRMFNELDSLNIGKLIIDVRLNSGGQHFEMPLVKGIIDRPNIDKEGNLFLIIGRRTFSASQHLTTQLEIYTNVTIYGEPTSARPNMVGSITNFQLPNSNLKCFTAQNYTQDSEYWDSRLMTKPHIFSLLSSTDYKKNYDPVIDAVFAYDSIINKKEKLKIEMQKGYKNDGITGLKNAFLGYKYKCQDAGINFEYFFMDEFSWWIYTNRKDTDDYSKYIKFVVDELPDSMRANYWYARNCHLKDKSDLALKYYKKCLSINPAHERAKKYLGLLLMHNNYEIKNYGL